MCNECGFIFINPRYSNEELKLKYKYIEELGSVKYRNAHTPPTKLDIRANRIYSLISNYFNIDHHERSKILDYGGASGYNLIPFIEKFKCYIVDYEKWDLPKGITYIGNDLHDLRKDNKFDIILLQHTLEHVPEPKIFLNELSEFISDRGLIYVEVPLGSFREWKSITEPVTHVNFFSEESLFKCLKYCGLDTIHLNTSYQWVTHEKMWCINAICCKSSTGKEINVDILPISTIKQINNIKYYLPYVFEMKRYKNQILKMIRKW